MLYGANDSRPRSLPGHSTPAPVCRPYNISHDRPLQTSLVSVQLADDAGRDVRPQLSSRRVRLAVAEGETAGRGSRDASRAGGRHRAIRLLPRRAAGGKSFIRQKVKIAAPL